MSARIVAAAVFVVAANLAFPLSSLAAVSVLIGLGRRRLGSIRELRQPTVLTRVAPPAAPVQQILLPMNARSQARGGWRSMRKAISG